MQSAQSWKKSCSMVHKVGLNEKADHSRLGSMYNKFDANSTIGKVTNLNIIQLAFIKKEHVLGKHGKCLRAERAGRIL